MTDVHNQSDVGNQFNASTLNNPVFLYGEKKIAKYLGILPVIPEVFIGRDEKLQEVHDELFDGNNLLLLVNGEGGIGKTTLAAKYYQRYFSDYAHLGWVFAERSLGDAMLTLAEPLKVEFAPTDDADVRREKLLREMAGLKKPCLLVIDNANDLDDLAAHYHELRRCPNFHILLTTRIESFAHAKTCRVGHLDEASAIRLFTTHYPGHDRAEDGLLKELLRAIGYNTLVIELLAKNLDTLNQFRTGYPLSQMLDDLQGSGLFGLTKSAEVLTGYNPGSFRLREEEPEKVIAAMYDLAKLEPGEEQLLCVFSVLPAEPIAFDTLEALQPGNDQLERSLRALVKKGWIEYNAGAKQFKCSPVVQAVTRLQVGERLDEQCETLVDMLIEKLEYEPNTGHLLNTEYQHGLLIAKYAESVAQYLNTSGYRKAILFEVIGSFYSITGNLGKALICFEKYNNLRENLYESNQKDCNSMYGLVVSYLKLGDTYSSLGNLEKSFITYFKRYQLVIKFCESHPEDTRFISASAVTCERLGLCFSKLKNFEAAIIYYNYAVEVYKILYNWNSKDIKFKNGLAVACNNMGNTFMATGNIGKAMSYFNDGVTLSKDLHDMFPENGSFINGLAVAYESLGNAYYSLGNSEKAFFFFKERLKLSHKLHDQHPTHVRFKNELAKSYAKLGTFSRDQGGDLAEARRWFEIAKALWAELVNDAPAYAEFQKNLAWVKEALAAL